MHYIHQIDKWASEYLLPRLQGKKFKEVDKLSGGMGAYITFANHYLTIRVVCDRGVFDIEVGPSGQERELWSVRFVKDYLEPAAKGRWNLSLEQSAEFLVAHYPWCIENLSKAKYKETFKQIDERCRFTFENTI